MSRGGSGAYTVSLASQNAFAGPVTFSVTGLPNGTSSSFSSNPVTLTANGSGSSILTIRPNRNAARGTYTLTVTGSSGATSHSQTVTLTIQ